MTGDRPTTPSYDTREGRLRIVQLSLMRWRVYQLHAIGGELWIAQRRDELEVEYFAQADGGWAAAIAYATAHADADIARVLRGQDDNGVRGK